MSTLENDSVVAVVLSYETKAVFDLALLAQEAEHPHERSIAEQL